MKRKLFFVSNILIPLIIGGAIYIFLCPETYISVLFTAAFHIRIKGMIWKTGIWRKLVRCYFLDILWSYSFTFVLYVIIGKGKKAMITLISVCVILEIGIECLQLRGIISGTFDPLDILFEFLASVLGMLIIKLYHKKGLLK